MASNLKRIAETIADAPVIDEEKVAAAKKALACGTYKIDPDRIADKLISLDTALRHVLKRTRN